MPEERGSIYKSAANEIGEALKAKLGGEGFAPKDWSENLNLLGIASEDTEAAINSLKESEGSGERGSILLSTANAIGSMLNKKYNSQRGFSPAEWASATRKMKALETDTKSGGIVNLKGAKEVPITSLVGTINPTLEGTDTLVATRTGKNLAHFENAKGIDASGNIYEDSKRCATVDFIPIKSGVSYKVYAENNVGFILAVFNGNTLVRRVASIVSGDTLDTSGGDKFRLCIYGKGTYICIVEADKPRCMTSDDLDTSYTPYVAPTTYTANLGRTIYGGSADIVKGEGVDENGNTFTFDPIPINTSGDTENFYTSNGDTSITYYEKPTPYTRGSASGTIASIPEANTEFPFTKLKATIAPSVEGKDTVEVYNYGKNLANELLEWNETNRIISPVFLKSGTYTVSFQRSVAPSAIYIRKGDTIHLAGDAYATKYNSTFFTFTADEDTYYYVQIYRSGSSATWEDAPITEPQIEVGSSATQFEPYKQPTTYTAELGETVFSGSVDLVSGEVKSEYASDVMTSSYLSGLNTDYIGYEASTAYFGNHPSVWVRNWNCQRAAARKAGGIGCTCNYFPASMNNTTIFSSQYRIYFDVDGKNITSVQDFINYVANIEQGGNSLKIAFELATPSESSIEPQEIYPNKGVNNIWNDANGITEVGYFGE